MQAAIQGDQLRIASPSRDELQAVIQLLKFAVEQFLRRFARPGVGQLRGVEFAGLRQLFEERDNATLVTRGFYRFVRHPLYTFGLLFIWLTPVMTQNSLTVYIGATVYTLIGAYFEERKLEREFGQAYADYKRVTPMLIPGLKLSGNKSSQKPSY